MTRTYWHLQDLRKKPSAYQITTGRLLTHPIRGFEIDVPVAPWFERYGPSSSLQIDDWESFHDPRETTYARYCEIQHEGETLVDGLFRSIEDPSYALEPAWEDVLVRVVPTLRFPVHGLQMVAAYVGQLAPAGRIVIACTFQAGDEMRRIQRFAYRTAILRGRHPDIDAASRMAWESDPRWAPLRELIERLLVTYDWGEAFVALNLTVKPWFDALFTQQLARAAAVSGDGAFAEVLRSLYADCAWHQQWSGALVDRILDGSDDNRKRLIAWRERWDPLVIDAMRGALDLFEGVPGHKELLPVVERSVALSQVSFDGRSG